MIKRINLIGYTIKYKEIWRVTIYFNLDKV